MAQLDSQIPFQALSQFRAPSSLEQLSQAAPIADIFKKQREQEMMADIFSRNIQVNPETGVRELNQQGALAELYGQQPENALKMEMGWATAQKPQYTPYERAMMSGLGGIAAQQQDPWNDPNKLMDFKQQVATPEFQSIAQGYAKDPAKWSPKLQQFYAEKGFTGQKWLNTEHDNMFKTPPINTTTAANQNLGKTIEIENQLKDEYEKLAGESRTISRAGNDIAQALKTNNAVSVLTAVKKLAKIGDPTTGVLGGEADQTEKAIMGDALNRFQGIIKRTATGGFTEESKKNLAEATNDFMKVQKDIMAKIQKRTGNRFDTYTKRFGQLNLSKDAVMGSEEDRAAELAAFDIFKPASKGPKAGTIINGFKFKGGDSKDKKNWVKVK